MITDISDVEIVELKEPKFVRPVRILYKQEGKQKSWEAVKAHDSVAVLLSAYRTRKSYTFELWNSKKIQW